MHGIQSRMLVTSIVDLSVVRCERAAGADEGDNLPVAG